MASSWSSASVNELRGRAEQCMKAHNYTEAFFHWTHAIKLRPKETHFLFQRSKCFLKQEQLYYAMQDAEKLIELSPGHSDGYLRKGEALFGAQQFARALPVFQKGFQVSASDKESFMDWVKKCKKEMHKESALDAQYPFVGAAIGIIVSVLGVVMDYIVNQQDSYLAHPFLKVAVVILVSITCYFFALKYRQLMLSSRSAALEPPLDLFGGSDKSD